MRSGLQPDAARPGLAPPKTERVSRRNAAERFARALPVALIAVLGGGAFLWRVLAWQPAPTVDAWAYAAWGQAISRAERPLFDLGATTPKPLAALLGALVVPLPAERALAVVVALALGGLAASLFAAAYREGGAVAGAAAVVALAAGARLDVAVAFAYIDVVVAALVMAGVALRGRLRMGAFVLAGLLRPEVWPLAAVAGFSETAGALRRRAGGALVTGLAAPALWIVADLALIGDPLGTLHWQRERERQVGAEDLAWSEVPGEFWTALTQEGRVVLVLVGLLGLGLHYVRARRSGSVDPMPLAVVLVWSLVLVLEARYGGLNARYFLPVVAVLALGCGLLVATVVPTRLRVGSAWPGAAVAVGALVIAALVMGRGPGVMREIARNEAIAETRPAVESVLSCGRFGTTRRTARRGVIPQLAASTRSSLYDFGIYRGGRRFSGVLHFAPRRPQAEAPLPSWLIHYTPLGPLAVAPGCRAFE
jgi:hypothetical protein